MGQPCLIQVSHHLVIFRRWKLRPLLVVESPLPEENAHCVEEVGKPKSFAGGGPTTDVSNQIRKYITRQSVSDSALEDCGSSRSMIVLSLCCRIFLRTRSSGSWDGCNMVI